MAGQEAEEKGNAGRALAAVPLARIEGQLDAKRGGWQGFLVAVGREADGVGWGELDVFCVQDVRIPSYELSRGRAAVPTWPMRRPAGPGGAEHV